MEQSPIKKQNNMFQTFRDPAGSLDTNPTLKVNPQNSFNQTANRTLRYSNLAQNSHLGSSHNKAGIICPIYKQAGIYKCQICSRLRQVCPMNRITNYYHAVTHQNKNTQTTSIDYRHTHIRNPYNISHNSNFTPYKNRQRPNVSFTDRPKTPSFIQKKQFIHSVPNIPRSHLPQIGVTPFQISHPVQAVPTPAVFQVPQGGVTLPKQTSRPASVSTRPKPMRVMYEVLYVPVVNNVLVPEITNPQAEVNSYDSPTRSRDAGSPISQAKSPYGTLGQSRREPINHKFDKNVIMSPQSLRKLAESIVR